ncbi:four helix bundle protein [Flavobacterium macrobrachii]|jgi:four helix bundle protein|uniref:Four helix bundle protein n=1 Tax=Flavobacterium macrobrachii TaxID=591204 RepID=A0ABS2CXM6_9FLAO|nr:four helix bundle protein [Flavobacterium macrobrachii]MBM6499716.1 four helix bundle protein [Flavobacterium macrobrachii]
MLHQDKDLKNRTKQFTIGIFNFAESLDYSIVKKVVVNQITKSGSSVGANYRSACRGRSDAEFLSKMNIVLEEADETLFWLEIIEEMNWKNNDELQRLLKEANELTAIFVTIIKNTKNRINIK